MTGTRYGLSFMTILGDLEMPDSALRPPPLPPAAPLVLVDTLSSLPVRTRTTALD